MSKKHHEKATLVMPEDKKEETKSGETTSLQPQTSVATLSQSVPAAQQTATPIEVQVVDSKAGQKMVKVRIREDVTRMRFGTNIYQFRKNQEVTIPEVLAKFLAEKGIV